MLYRGHSSRHHRSPNSWRSSSLHHGCAQVPASRPIARALSRIFAMEAHEQISKCRPFAGIVRSLRRCTNSQQRVVQEALRKVPAHVDVASCDTELAREDARGNDAADRVAKKSLALHPKRGRPRPTALRRSAGPTRPARRRTGPAATRASAGTRGARTVGAAQ